MEFFLSGNGDLSLPYELQAFEVPLAATVRLFESEAAALEGKLLPSLDRLTAKVTNFICIVITVTRLITVDMHTSWARWSKSVLNAAVNLAMCSARLVG